VEEGEQRALEVVELVKKEEVKAGNMPWSLYWRYVRAGAPAMALIALALLYISMQGLLVLTAVWISLWTSDDDPDGARYASILLGLCGAALVGQAARGMLLMEVLQGAAQGLHQRALMGALKSPLQFFQSSTTGRVMSRLSRDVAVLDELLTMFGSQVAQYVTESLGIVGLAGASVPPTLAVVLPIVYGSVRLQRYYLKTSRDLRRIEGTARSPLFTSLSIALGGLATVRAYGLEQSSRTAFFEALDHHRRVSEAFKGAERWFGMRLDLIVVTFAFCFALCAVLFSSAIGLEAAMVGLAMAQVLQLAGTFQFAIRQQAEFTNFMTSTERLFEYADLTTEADAGSAAMVKHAGAGCPAIEFDDFWYQWRSDLPRTLDGISFSVPAACKCGIIGRTGAGKSSLVAALFRLSGVQGGKLAINGVRVADVPLTELRRALGVLPQAPTIFAGTVRFNLAPMGNVNTQTLWGALERAQLRSVIEALPQGLDTPVNDDTSLSQGERQLLCLARALLASTDILVLDEATSSCDDITDSKIQLALKAETESRGLTTLVIAHRLLTIADADLIIQLEQGRVLKVGTPAEVLPIGSGLGQMSLSQLEDQKLLAGEQGC